MSPGDNGLAEVLVVGILAGVIILQAVYSLYRYCMRNQRPFEREAEKLRAYVEGHAGLSMGERGELEDIADTIDPLGKCERIAAGGSAVRTR